MKRTLAITALILISSLLFAGGSGELSFGTGGDQGTYYGFGSVLAQRISAETDTKVTAVVSNGSQDNIEMMDMGYNQLGFVQSDVMSYAYEGTNLFADNAITNFSTIGALYMEQVQIVTLNPAIKTVADLQGKTVSIGSSGSGVINPTYQSFGDSVDALQDGKIDAAFVVAGAPTVAVSTLASTRDVYLVSIDDEHIENLIATSPYYSKNIIDASVYGTDENCQTVAIAAVIIANDDVSDDDAYNIISTIFNDKDSIAASHNKGAELDINFAASISNVPYHPGAARFYEENGITVPVK